jgi:opacity protein-like surface antigen
VECLDLQRKPAASFGYSFWQEEGPGRLADLTRHRGTATVEVPIADRHRLYFEEGLSSESAPKTTGGEHLFGLTGVSWTGQLNSQFNISAGYRLKTSLDDDLPDVHEARAGVSYRIRDEIRLDLGYDRVDEAHNDAALTQGITSDNLRVGLEARPLRRLEVGGQAKFTWYSDDNRGEFYEGHAGYSITDHPRQFKISLQGQARGTHEASVFSPEDLSSLNIEHPYWTPRGYAAGQLVFEWRHDLTREQFTGNLTHHYRLRVALGDDSDRNRSIQVDGGWHWDFTDRWSLDVFGMWYHSEAWKARSAQMSMRFRF